MRLRRSLILATVVCSLAVAPAFAQSVSKVLRDASRAHGGEKALKAIASRRLAGVITRVSDGAVGRYELLSAGGGLFLENYDIAGFEVSSGYNGRSAWLRDSRDGLRTATGDAARGLQAEATYRGTSWVRAKDEKMKLSFFGYADYFDGREANIVVLTSAKGSRIKLYFDRKTSLLMREEFADSKRSMEYADYRTVGSVRMAYSIRIIAGDEAYDIKIDTATINERVDVSRFEVPVLAGESLPDIPKLLDDVRRNADDVDRILENYSYTETRIERDVKSTGEFVEKSSEKQELTFYKGYRITRTIEKNGRPLSPSDQAREDRDAQKQVAEIEKRIAEKLRKEGEDARRDIGTSRTGAPNGEGQRITIADALKGSLLVNPRRERFGGRQVIVFDFKPDPSFKPKTRNEKIFAICSGVVWVDAATRQVVRLEATLTQSAGNFIAKAKRGASFTLENEFINNEIWLPYRADIDLEIKILFAGIRINNLIKYGDYRRFETEVRDATVNPEKP